MLYLLGFIFINELLLISWRQLPPHCSNFLSDIPKFEFGIWDLHRVPQFSGIAHIRHDWLFWRFWWLWCTSICLKFIKILISWKTKTIIKRVRDFFTHSSAVLADFLRCKGRISMGRMNERTLVLYTIWWSTSRSSQTFYTKKDETKVKQTPSRANTVDQFVFSFKSNEWLMYY